MTKQKHLLLLQSIWLFFYILQSAQCQDGVTFDRKHFGVTFQAKIKGSENGDEVPGPETYTFENVKTMLRVVSTKFSEVLVEEFQPENATLWSTNFKTYFGKDTTAFAPEAAAQINQEADQLLLSMLIEITVEIYDTEFNYQSYQFAIKKANLANQIYPGTVKGIIFRAALLKSMPIKMTNILELVTSKEAAEAKNSKLILGTRMFCDTFMLSNNTDVVNVVNQVLVKSDIVICEAVVNLLGFQMSTARSFDFATQFFVKFESVARQVNPTINYAASSMWKYSGTNNWENPASFKHYWQLANNWSVASNVSFYMVGAFDNPRRYETQVLDNYGWWRLKKNSMINSMGGYWENILEKKKANAPEDEADVKSIVMISVIGGAFGIFMIVCFVLLFIRVSRLKQRLDKDDMREFIYGNGLLNDENPILGKPYDMKFEVSKEDLVVDTSQILGMGQYGCVFLGSLKLNGMDRAVAVKTVKENCPKTAIKNLLTEIKVLAHIGTHANIVSLEGAYTAELIYGVVFVAIELCSRGSLEKYLRSYENYVENHQAYLCEPDDVSHSINENNYLSTTNDHRFVLTNDMIKWAKEIACGMEHLSSKQVVHADLATRNILLTTDKTAKITDFGLSRRMYNYQNYIKRQKDALPWRSMAIECLKRNEFSTESDVWAYGVTLWEIFSMGDTPYSGFSWNLEFTKSLTDGLRLESPQYAAPNIYSIMLRCWSADPKTRPGFYDIRQELMQA